MPIPPHRAPGDIGHIGDHNDIADVLTEQQTDIASNSTSIISHTTGTDPHGDRAYANDTFALTGHTHSYPVSSVNGLTGDVSITAGSLGAETPSGAQAKVDALAGTVIPLSQKGAISGVAELDSGGKVPLAQLPSGGSTISVTMGWENVVDHGAVGDGSTDDTAAIDAAITAAMAGTRKKPVYFPPGDYLRTAGIPLQDGLTMIAQMGHGKEFDRRVNLINNTTDMFVYGGTGATDATQRPKDIVLQGITFVGNQTKAFLTPSAENASGAYPVDMDIVFCGMKNFTQVISAPALRMKIIDCYINDCTNTPLNISGSDNYIFRNFIDSYIAGSHTTDSVVTLNCEESVFSQNYVTCAPQIGIKVRQHSTGLRITDNTINGLAQGDTHGGFTSTQGPGIYVASGANGVVISGNTLANNCADPWSAGTIFDGAITVADAIDITVMGNVIYNVLSPTASHVRIQQISGTTARVKVVGNVYLTDSGDEAPRIAKSGTLTDIYIDEEQGASPVTSVNSQTGDVVLTAADVSALATTARGAANGVASLDATTKVPAAQLPDLSGSYVTTGADNNPQVANAASARGFARVDLNYTATGTTPDSFAFYYGGASGSGGTRTGYHNEYGELRARPALQSTVALRAMGHTAGSTGNIFEVAHAALTPVYLAVSQTAAVFSVPVTATDLTATGNVTADNLPPSIGSGTTLPDPAGFSDGAVFFLHA